MSKQRRRNLPHVGFLCAGLCYVGLLSGVVGLLGGGLLGGVVLYGAVLLVLVLDVLGSLLVDLLGSALSGLLSGVLGTVRRGVDGVLTRRGSSRTEASGHAVTPAATPRSLRWVRGVLPDGEGAAWLGEVGSCLAETPDKVTRRRYIRGYRRSVPQLIWTSWAEHLSASRRRELL